uniref:Uncharacterized protein n=1 Tax=Setaria italica TaxID=4555 RepID=K4ANJ3_SETIT
MESRREGGRMEDGGQPWRPPGSGEGERGKGGGGSGSGTWCGTRVEGVSGTTSRGGRTGEWRWRRKA